MFFLLRPPPPRSTLFPYTTLFRSLLLALSFAIPLFASTGRVYVTNSAGNSVDVVDSATNKVVQVIKGIEVPRSEEHTSELQSHVNLVCRLLLEKKKKKHTSKI